MKKKITTITSLLLAFSLLANAQQQTQKGFLINGHIDGIEDGTKVYLHDVGAQTKIDSAISSKGNFVFKGYVERPITCWIECKDQYAILQVENTKMEFNSPFNNMRLYATVRGGKEQELQNELTDLQHPYEVIYFNAYDSLTKKLFTDKDHQKRLIKALDAYQDTAQSIYITFGKTHPNSFLGLDILYRNRQKIGKDSVEKLLLQMDDELRATEKSQGLATFVYGELAEKGKPFIDFDAETANGVSFTLSSLKGKYILLSFWNASCGPCRRENKKISGDYNRLKNKIAIVSFSTDKNKSAWLKASKDDNILWTNISDLKGSNGKIKTQYNVQAIPTSYLINKEGVIVEKFIGLDDDFLNQLEKLITTE